MQTLFYTWKQHMFCMILIHVEFSRYTTAMQLREDCTLSCLALSQQCCSCVWVPETTHPPTCRIGMPWCKHRWLHQALCWHTVRGMPCIDPTCSALSSLRHLSHTLYFPSLSEFYLYQKFTLRWSAHPSWPVSNLSYCTVWLEPTLHFPVCITVTESKVSLLTTQ